MRLVTKEEQTTIVISILAALGFCTSVVLNGYYSYTFKVGTYLSIHTILEILSVIVSYAIALQGWLTFNYSASKYRILLGALFLTIGSFDLIHVLSFKGMPDFITPSSVAKATWFWIAARLTEAFFLAAIFLKPDKIVNCNKWKLIYLASPIYFLVISKIIISYESYLPLLVNPDIGVTVLKRTFEYVISAFHMLVILSLIRKNYGKTRSQTLALLKASVFILFGELVFTLYRNVYELENLVGHIYKVIGYYYFLRGIYITTLDEPFTEKRKLALKLRETEEELFHIFNYSLDMVCIINFEGYLRRVNPAFVKNLGYTYIELAAKPLKNLIHPEDTKGYEQALSQMVMTGKSLDRSENRILTKEGKVRWFEWIAVPDVSKRFIYAVVRDVTQRKKMDSLLMESEERFRSAFEMAGTGMALVSISERKIIKANRMLCEFLGYSEQRLQTLTIEDLTYKDDLKEDLLFLDRLIKGQIQNYQLEKRYIHRKGHSIWAQLNVSLIKNSKGEPLRLIAQIQDITKQKEAYNKLLQLAAIVEHSDDAIISKDVNGIITSWNKAAERVFGYSEKEIVGKPISILADKDRKYEVDNILSKINRREHILNFETLRTKKNGEPIYISKTVSPIIDAADQVIGASTIVRDITSRRRMEQEINRLDRLNLVAEMAASISHEVRNPLTTVKGFLQMLKTKEDQQKYVGYFDLMVEEIDRANSIITEFLSIGRTKLEDKKKHNLNTIIEAIIPLIQADALSEDKYIQTKLLDVPDIILNDKEIRQVILNLTRNGLESMKAGGYLSISTGVENNQVVLAISDQGSGINEEVAKYIGTPFYTTKDKGTGLGLGVCYRIAQQHNAKLFFETSSSGTTFYLAFNLQLA